MFDESNLVSTEVDDIVISAGSSLVEENAAKKEFLWGYYFCIENNSNHKISLVGKNWRITDDKGNSYSDSSDGFKGEIPDLEPGESYEFSSMAPLESPQAVFYGSCRIKTADSAEKDIKIPTFQLSANRHNPRVLN